jgi:BCD family chlorophyll transporter-like MFS transporter
VLLAKRVDPRRRAAAATLTWIMMIFGIVITATVAGGMLEPFSPARLVEVTACVATIALLLTTVAVWNVEQAPPSAAAPATDAREQDHATAKASFFDALRQVWSEPRSRQFACFVFVSMLAYSAQDLILEPFAGAVFGFTPGQTTKLAGVLHGGVLVGMLLVAVLGTRLVGSRLGSMRTWTVAGCAASAAALLALATAGFVGPAWPLRESVFALGVANGAFAVSAIGSMMGLASSGTQAREGTRMGVWGAAQAVAFGLGGFLGTLGSDIARSLLGSPVAAYATVFTCEACLFLFAANLAAKIGAHSTSTGDKVGTTSAASLHAAPYSPAHHAAEAIVANDGAR